MNNWRKLSNAELEEYLDTLDDSTKHWEDVAYELDLRQSCANDSRVAQAMGCATGPSNDPS